MNFIVGSFLYHSSEEFAFWLLVSLFDKYELRDIFEPGLPGLYKHCFIIDELLKVHIPDLYAHFVSNFIISIKIELMIYRKSTRSW